MAQITKKEYEKYAKGLMLEVIEKGDEHLDTQDADLSFSDFTYEGMIISTKRIDDRWLLAVFEIRDRYLKKFKDSGPIFDISIRPKDDKYIKISISMDIGYSI